MDQVKKIMDDAAQAFSAWRDKNDPNHELPIEVAAERYCADAMKS